MPFGEYFMVQSSQIRSINSSFISDLFILSSKKSFTFIRSYSTTFYLHLWLAVRLPDSSAKQKPGCKVWLKGCLSEIGNSTCNIFTIEKIWVLLQYPLIVGMWCFIACIIQLMQKLFAVYTFNLNQFNMKSVFMSTMFIL